MKPTPETRDKIPTKPIAEREADVAEAISSLNWMPNYPKEEKAFAFFCMTLASFIQTVDRCHWDFKDPDPEWNEKYAMGWTNPLKWVVEQVGSTCEFFPPPIKWREIYCSHFPPLDKKRPADLWEIVGD